MRVNKKIGMTLVENLITIALLGLIVMTTIGGFVVAKMGAIRAQHRTIAMGLIREFMEREVQAGYNGGQYFTATPGVRIDPIDNTAYTIQSNPPAAVDGIEGVRHYKIIGFIVQWNEPILGGAGVVPCSERAVTYVAQHTP
jgi:type II secretory pathway pseudopilin PulG